MVVLYVSKPGDDDSDVDLSAGDDSFYYAFFVLLFSLDSRLSLNLGTGDPLRSDTSES